MELLIAIVIICIIIINLNCAKKHVDERIMRKQVVLNA